MSEEAKANTNHGTLPYIAFKTIETLRVRMAEEAVPNRIDKSYLDSFSGGYQSQVLAALTTLRLIDDEQRPTTNLKELVVADTKGQREVIYRIVYSTYGPILELERNTTNQQLIDAFSELAPKVTGDTRRKAIAFFLNACKFAGIEVGPNWKTPPVSPSGKRKSKPKEDPGNRESVHDTPPASHTQPQGEKKVVDLGPAGTVTLYVDVKWLDLSEDTFSSLRDVVNQLTALGVESDGFDDQDVEDEGES